MQPPRFWYDDASGRDAAPALQLLLRPVSWVYAAVARGKVARARPEAVLPAVCVGNATAGGAGKTPIVRAVRARLSARGVDAHTLSRGYGGALKGPLRVDGGKHTAADVGDEPLLHARDGAAWIGADRVAAARAAKAAGAQALVLDDGFQNMGLAYALSLLVFDARLGAGNGRVHPAGPLREPLGDALSRADGVIVMRDAAGDGEIQARLRHALGAFRGPVIPAWIAPSAPLPDKPLFAFAGIGQPDKFFATLEAAGARLAGRLAFPDHHPYSERDMTNLAIDAAASGARLITTEKDFVRIGTRWKPQVSVLPVGVHFADEAALDALLSRIG
ncbi:MAG: tetraacyldisaccharide 4'-kinase [Hyphomonadaceae bacterium]|nr:tetraacyldisaccharide 4'-kinase [Hyphomonadaceae bacterium]